MKNKYKTLKSVLAAIGFMATAQMIAQTTPTYCPMQATSTNDEELFNVTLGNLNNTSICGATGGPGSIAYMYNNYTNSTPAVPVPVLFTGFSYPASVTAGECNGNSYSGIVKVWIDYNQNGSFADPGENVYTSGYGAIAVAGTVYNYTLTIPAISSSVVAGVTRMRVAVNESSAITLCSNFTWGEVEDYNVNIQVPVPCAGNPAATSVTGPTANICGGANVQLGLTTTYSTTGISYAWQTSTLSPVGPWTAIPSGTNPAIVVNNTVTAYYSAVITCANGGGQTTSSSGTLNIAATQIDNVPYQETFEGITANNQLPNCSWKASNVPSTTQTYIQAQSQYRSANSGTKFAAFYYSPAGTGYFWTNGINLVAGVTYSAGLWYKTDYYGYVNWDLNMVLSSSQATAGITQTVATTGGVASSPSYKLLSNTFQVATSGVYYLGVAGKSAGNCCGYYMCWDDIFVNIPCSLNPNPISITSSTNTVCEGTPVNLTASGTANTYTWNVGGTGSAISYTPSAGITPISVATTNTITNCPGSANTQIQAYSNPIVGIYAPSNSVCKGSPIVLQGLGALNYNWSNQSSGLQISVSPTTTTSYSVTGINQYGCSGQAAITISVNNLPTIIASGSNNQMCVGETVTLSAQGANTYTWTSNNNVITGSAVVISPMSSVSYNVVGTDAKGCNGTANFQVSVSACTGITENTSATGISVYPNPSNGEFVVVADKAGNTIEVTDLTGRVVLTAKANEKVINLDIKNLASGVYYLKVQSEKSAEVVKIIKE